MKNGLPRNVAEASLASLLPNTTVVREGDLRSEATLVEGEARFVSRAVSRRRHEFASGRSLARDALRAFGHSSALIPSDKFGAPLWPTGIVGSITHTANYVAVAACHDTVMGGLGIDAEQQGRVHPGLLTEIATAQELACADPAIQNIGDLLFSAKESVYKCIWPVSGLEVGFLDLQIHFEQAGRFAVHCDLADLSAISGAWCVTPTLVKTVAYVVPGCG